MKPLIYIYMYIYIYRERERERHTHTHTHRYAYNYASLSLSLPLSRNKHKYLVYKTPSSSIQPGMRPCVFADPRIQMLATSAHYNHRNQRGTEVRSTTGPIDSNGIKIDTVFGSVTRFPFVFFYTVFI